jgi:mannose-6-phosphate isomerase-like protein (cupin superfamily)
MTRYKPPGAAPLVERAGASTFLMDLHESRSTSEIQWYFRTSTQLPVAVNMWTLPPGASEAVHVHDRRSPIEELYVVVDGIAEAQVGSESYTLSAGDAYLAPVDLPHDLKNVGSGDLRVIVVWGPTADRTGMPIHDASLTIVRAAEHVGTSK